MKYNFLVILSLFILLASCSEKEEPKTPITSSPVNTILDIPNKIVDLSALHYNNKTSLWTMDDQHFSGYAVTFYQDSILKEKFGILNGKKQNESTLWFPDGHFKQVARYHKGKLHGEKKKWSSDSSHILIAHYQYQFGKANGQQKMWYPTGELFKVLNLEMGKEEGIQQAYRKNGALFANYEARDGRIFGLKRTALCYGLEDEVIQYKK